MQLVHSVDISGTEIVLSVPKLTGSKTRCIERVYFNMFFFCSVGICGVSLYFPLDYPEPGEFVVQSL